MSHSLKISINISWIYVSWPVLLSLGYGGHFLCSYECSKWFLNNKLVKDELKCCYFLENEIYIQLFLCFITTYFVCFHSLPAFSTTALEKFIDIVAEKSEDVYIYWSEWTTLLRCKKLLSNLEFKTKLAIQIKKTKYRDDDVVQPSNIGINVV